MSVKPDFSGAGLGGGHGSLPFSAGGTSDVPKPSPIGWVTKGLYHGVCRLSSLSLDFFSQLWHYSLVIPNRLGDKVPNFMEKTGLPGRPSGRCRRSCGSIAFRSLTGAEWPNASRQGRRGRHPRTHFAGRAGNELSPTPGRPEPCARADGHCRSDDDH